MVDPISFCAGLLAGATGLAFGLALVTRSPLPAGSREDRELLDVAIRSGMARFTPPMEGPGPYGAGNLFILGGQNACRFDRAGWPILSETERDQLHRALLMAGINMLRRKPELST